MGDIATGFNTAFRDYQTEGVPSSGANPPDKAEARALGALIEDAIGPAQGVTTLTGDANTITADHVRQWLEVSHSLETTLTIPADADVAFPDGAFIEGCQAGDGQITFEGNGFDVEVAENQQALSACKGAVWGLKRIDTDVWRLFGNLAAA